MPTFAEFAPRFIEGHAEANRHKLSTKESTQTHLRMHILPAFGDKRLDQLTKKTSSATRGSGGTWRAKTVNNQLSTLRTMITAAVEWGLIERSPVEIKQLKATKPKMHFCDFDEFEALIEGAAKIDLDRLSSAPTDGRAL